MRLVRALAALTLAVLAGAAAASAQAGPSAPVTRAVGYAALLPGGTQGAVSAVATGPERNATSAGGLRPVGGGLVGRIDVVLIARSAGRTGVSEGTIAISGVTLLDGRVRIGGIGMAARAEDGPGGASGELRQASVTGLVVDGQPVAAGPGSRVAVPGIGTLVFLEQSSDGAGGLEANALRVEVSDPAAAALIGQPFVLGHLELSAVSPPPEPAEPARTATAPDSGDSTTAPATTAPATTTSPSPALSAPSPLGLPRRAVPAVTIPSDGGYVFPVAGDTSFTDDYGAPRAGTGWHHGNDLFADRGTPVVAVADGTLSRVGVNTLGGNRLWLTDDRGNTFYYAHLSAYAPATVDGARVRAGQVIAFVGNTGQAITTPPHLHFEIHPADGDSVDPYPYLLAWKRGTGVSRSFAQAVVSTSPAPAVGAVLVDTVPEVDQPPPDDGLASPAT